MIPWDTIIPIVVDLISGCFDNEAAMTTRVKQARLGDQVRLRLALRRSGYARDVIQGVIEEWRSCCSPALAGDGDKIADIVALAAIK